MQFPTKLTSSVLVQLELGSHPFSPPPRGFNANVSGSRGSSRRTTVTVSPQPPPCSPGRSRNSEQRARIPQTAYRCGPPQPHPIRAPTASPSPSKMRTKPEAGPPPFPSPGKPKPMSELPRLGRGSKRPRGGLELVDAIAGLPVAIRSLCDGGRSWDIRVGSRMSDRVAGGPVGTQVWGPPGVLCRASLKRGLERPWVASMLWIRPCALSQCFIRSSPRKSPTVAPAPRVLMAPNTESSMSSPVGGWWVVKVRACADRFHALRTLVNG